MVGRREPNTNEPVEPGDVLWVKTYGSWWPAQVFDENTVSEKKKPKKKMAGEVLVRLYGDYTFLYWHPGRFKTEFLDILEQNNGSYKEMLDTFLEQELSRVKSNQGKRKISESREQAKVEASKDKKLKPNGVKTGDMADNMDFAPHIFKTSTDMSLRRTKVMQSLGLVAPSDSPFRRIGVFYL